MLNRDLHREKRGMILRWVIIFSLFAGLFFFTKDTPLPSGSAVNLARLGFAAIIGNLFLQFAMIWFTRKEFNMLGLFYDLLVATFALGLTGGVFPGGETSGPAVNVIVILFPLIILNASGTLGPAWGFGASLSSTVIEGIFMFVGSSVPSWPLFLVLLAVNLGAFLWRPGSAGSKDSAGDEEDRTSLAEAEIQEDRDVAPALAKPESSGESPSIMDLVEEQEDLVVKSPGLRKQGKISRDEDLMDTLSGAEGVPPVPEVEIPVAMKNAGDRIDEMQKMIFRLESEKEDLERAYINATRESEARRRNEESLVEQLRLFNNLIELSGCLGSAFEFSDLLESIIQNVREQLNSPIAFIMLEDSGILQVVASAGLSEISKNEFECRVTTEDKLISRLMLDGELVRLNREEATSDFGIFDNGVEDFVTAMIAPLENLRDNRPMGILGVANQEFYAPYSREQEKFLKIFAAQAATFIFQFKLNRDMETTYNELLTALSQAIESRDPFTRGHVHRTAEFSYRLARAMKLPQREQKRIQQAAILHDIGKIAVPVELLNKPTSLTYEEYAQVKRHSQEGYKLLSRPELNIEDSIRDYVLYHHEHWDGQGYPKGIRGDEIPLGAQIIAVANTYDAMVSDRPYRKGMPREEALRLMNSESGKQFNPKVLHTFFEMLDYDKNTEKIRPLTTESIEIEQGQLHRMQKTLREINRKAGGRKPGT